MKDAYTIACAVVNLSIQEDCIIDLKRLHKLLYFAQCYSLARYSTPLFIEDITCHDCGPYVEALSRFYRVFGIGEYTKSKVSKGLLLSKKEIGTIEFVVKYYSEVTTPDLIWRSKQSKPYINRKQRGHGSVITMADMEKYGQDEFGIDPREQSPLDVASYVRETREILGLSEKPTKKRSKATVIKRKTPLKKIMGVALNGKKRAWRIRNRRASENLS